jgi:D-alanyl-D-alanine carboxypeptidase
MAALVLLQGPLSASSFAAQKRHAAHAHAASVPVHHTLPPFIAMDVASGRVIEARDATRPWYPASVTKLMTVYVALNAVRQGRLTLDTPLVVSARAASMKPSKMGFAPGSQVTLDNALKMLMVKSANDLAVTIAEGVSGSVESFAVEMNQTAAALGMRESHFVNPNGLPDPNHVSSARDMAILGRALLLAFPQHADLFNIGAMKLGEQVIPTHNGLIGRYPGADGMKTGFTCPAGFNLVASATREGRKVIVVVMGDSSARIRTAHAANLLDQAFAARQLGDAASDLPSVGGVPPDMRGEICVRRSGKAQLDAETEDFGGAIQPAEGSAAPAPGNGALIASLPRPVYEPVPVYVGAAPGYQGPVAGPRPANTPIGAIAYAPPPEHAAAPQPIKPDPKALSMHRASGATRKAKPEAKVQEAKVHEAKAHEAKAHGAKSKEAKVPSKAAAKTSAKVSKAPKARSKTAAPKPPAKAVNKSASTSGKTGQN